MSTFYVNREIYTAHKYRMVHFLVDNFMMCFIPFLALMLIRSFNRDLAVMLVYPIIKPTTNGFEAGDLLLYYYIGYYIFFEALFGKTPGKFFTGSKVVDANGERPDLLNIIGRTLLRFIPFEGFSFLTTWCRGWHDRFSNTYVVDEKEMKAAKAAFYEESKAIGLNDEIPNT